MEEAIAKRKPQRSVRSRYMRPVETIQSHDFHVVKQEPFGDLLEEDQDVFTEQDLLNMPHDFIPHSPSLDELEQDEQDDDLLAGTVVYYEEDDPSLPSSSISINHDNPTRTFYAIRQPKLRSPIRVRRVQAPVTIQYQHEADEAYSTPEEYNVMLNRHLPDEQFLDTRDLVQKVGLELKIHNIPQMLFAERILCRSQGTLSDLLRNPRPWNELKSGRETFRRMYNWLQQPLNVRLSILGLYAGTNNTATKQVAGVSRHMPAATSARSNILKRMSGDSSSSSSSRSAKKARFMFTEVQKRTLRAIFEETQRPSREMQETIARHLRLDVSTVSNFFMNSRRRYKRAIEAKEYGQPNSDRLFLSYTDEDGNEVDGNEKTMDSQVDTTEEHMHVYKLEEEEFEDDDDLPPPLHPHDCTTEDEDHYTQSNHY